MPELPEVETVRRGLAPAMENATFQSVELRRSNLRFPLPEKFAARLKGAKVEVLGRRGKYLVASLSTGECLIAHLGMSGRFSVDIENAATLGDFHHETAPNPAHDHVIFQLKGPAGSTTITYNDPRRFGFMDLAETAQVDECRHFRKMGPEPLGNQFSGDVFNIALEGKQAPIKAALLDQAVVAGVGNIYACEALFNAGISPRRKAASVKGVRGERLAGAIKEVLREAIEAGGSTLRDFASSDGALGYFQHRFSVYDREGEPCVSCGAFIKRIVQSGRSTFFCSRCQR